MQRRNAIGTWMKLSGVLVLLSFASGVGADIRVPGGAPPPGTTTWILVSKPPKRDGRGPGAKKTAGEPGVQIHAQGAPDGRAVTSDINPTTGASGDVRNAHKGQCDCIHYHGSLFGKADPKRGERCGWGCVIPFDQAPDSVAFLSAAVMFEERASLKAIEQGNIPGAIDDLEDGIESLQDALASEPQVGEGNWDPRNSREYKEALNKVIKLDQQAVEALTEAMSANGRDKIRLLDKADDKLSAALRIKRKMILKLAKELGLGEHGDDED